MKSLLMLFGACLCTLTFSSCSKSNPPAEPPAAANKTDDAPAAAPAPADDKAGTFWELPNKADLRVVTAPWPPKAGSATLKAEVTADDDATKFAGTVAYRITATEKSSAAWIPMPKTSETGDKSLHFEAPVTLTNGTVFIQFRIHGAGESAYGKDHFDLTDWKVEVK